MSDTRAKLPEEHAEKCRPLQITSDHFRERARHYRLAAATADVARDVATFRELATMFDQIARQFDRAEPNQSSICSRARAGGLAPEGRFPGQELPMGGRLRFTTSAGIRSATGDRSLHVSGTDAAR
jgi:hypothetical protein